MNRVLQEEGFDEETLDKLSCKSRLGISLQRTVRHVDRSVLETELTRVEDWYDVNEILAAIRAEYRVKSLQSALHKYDRYYPDGRLSRVFDDLLGFRVLTDAYEDVMELADLNCFRLADMRYGKKDDDGYRGVHLYYQKSNFHYPIEIQINTYYDRQFNDWAHDHLYKRKEIESSVGRLMRAYYEQGRIRSDAMFREVLNDVLSGSKGYV